MLGQRATTAAAGRGGQDARPARRAHERGAAIAGLAQTNRDDVQPANDANSRSRPSWVREPAIEDTAGARSGDPAERLFAEDAARGPKLLRPGILLKRNPLLVMLDLGYGILDDATVEAAAIVLKGGAVSA